MVLYPKLGAKYSKYEGRGQTKWQCKDTVSDIFKHEEDATKLCDQNPSCRYIENIDCLGLNFKLCTSLETSSESCVLQRTESRFDNIPYQEFKLGDVAKWECKDHLGFYRYFEDAVADCNQNLFCNYIENEDCSGTEGYEICKDVEDDAKSCAFVKKGSHTFYLSYLVNLIVIHRICIYSVINIIYFFLL